MLTFGILTCNPESEWNYFSEIAKRAKNFSTKVCCFSPTDIDPMTEKVHGLIFHSETNEWAKEVFPIPTYLYDRCFYSTEEKQKKYAPIVHWLKNRKDLIFIGNGLPNKWKRYHVLSSDPTLKYYIPKTIQITHPKQVLAFLHSHQQIVLKPERGSQGRGLWLLYVINEQIHVKTQQQHTILEKTFSSEEQLYPILQKLLSTHSYLAQRYLCLYDHSYKPFDIRILLQKDRNGSWKEIGRGIRKGQKNHIISNLHGGGTAYPFDEWIESIPTHQRALILDDIQTILFHLPNVLEQHFAPLFELGIDIGLAKDGTLWVLDVNSKPGYETIRQTTNDPHFEEKLYEAPLSYCNYMSLLRRNKQ